MLDTATGRPAAGVEIELRYIEESVSSEGATNAAANGDTAAGGLSRGEVIEAVTDGDGHTAGSYGGRDERVIRARTNDDGRTASPLLAGAAMRTGLWRLVFAVGDYYRAHHHPDAGTFLDRVAIEFRIADADAAYHVPLLVTPWSYSTYRGS